MNAWGSTCVALGLLAIANAALADPPAVAADPDDGGSASWLLLGGGAVVAGAGVAVFASGYPPRGIAIDLTPTVGGGAIVLAGALP